MHATPPRRWVESTLAFNAPEHIRPALSAALWRANPPQGVAERLMARQAYPPDSDQWLADRIKMDDPRFCFGSNGLNRYGHGAWAFAVLGEHDKAWGLIQPIARYAARLMFPIGTLKMLVFLAIRNRSAHHAALGLEAIQQWHGHLNDVDCGELQRHALALLSPHPFDATP